MLNRGCSAIKATFSIACGSCTIFWGYKILKVQMDKQRHLTIRKESEIQKQKVEKLTYQEMLPSIRQLVIGELLVSVNWKALSLPPIHQKSPKMITPIWTTSHHEELKFLSTGILGKKGIPSFSGWTVRQASGGIRAEIVHLREVKDAVNELPPEVRWEMLICWSLQVECPGVFSHRT